MRAARVIVVVGLLGVAVIAATAYAGQAAPGDDVPAADGEHSNDIFGGAWGDLVDTVRGQDDELIKTMPNFSADANVVAFLDLIRRCEGTAGAADPYRVCYAYRHTIKSLSDHPAVSGEWRGERLSDSMCAAAGYGSGCVSTAAGAYQFIKPTWLALKAQIKAVDFGPVAQDAAAIQLLKNVGAYGRIRAGDLAGAVARAASQWASLPGSTAGQGGKSFGQVQAMYRAAGGAVA